MLLSRYLPLRRAAELTLDLLTCQTAPGFNGADAPWQYNHQASPTAASVEDLPWWDAAALTLGLAVINNMNGSGSYPESDGQMRHWDSAYVAEGLMQGLTRLLLRTRSPAVDDAVLLALTVLSPM
jgi:hypothetical protein